MVEHTQSLSVRPLTRSLPVALWPLLAATVAAGCQGEVVDERPEAVRDATNGDHDGGAQGGSPCSADVECASDDCRDDGTCAPAAATCSDALKNGNETDVDCGGTDCPPCADGATCALSADCSSSVCLDGTCRDPSCTDGEQNNDETDVDCGGPNSCPRCPQDANCIDGLDCLSGVCVAGACAPPRCDDGVKNGAETDVDCGGPRCGACDADSACASQSGGVTDCGCRFASDCNSGVCAPDSSTCAAPSCTDGRQNGDETGVDCGGSCSTACLVGDGCASDDDCAGDDVCRAGMCRPDQCNDGVKNGTETDVDCGGDVCAPCGTVKDCSTESCGCSSGSDCATGVCELSSFTCVATATCSDGVQNQDETDVDCGGSCESCPAQSACTADADCGSGSCVDGACLAGTCDNQTQDGDETGVDCGGSCAPCAAGTECISDADCASRVCTESGACAEPTCSDGVRNGRESGVDCGAESECGPCAVDAQCGDDYDCQTFVCDAQTNTCMAATCTDAVQNGDETGVDCGGNCGPCAAGTACSDAADCASGVCTDAGECAAPTCSDGTRNGNETGVDCGGTCPDGCPNGAACELRTDCQSEQCVTNVCIADHCNNDSLDAALGETGVDCGGPDCAACPDDAGCTEGSDCHSGVCVNGACAAPTCSDNFQNQDETGVDCGGSCPEGCAAGADCSEAGDCASGVCSTGKCQVGTCSDGVQNQDETDVDCGGACDGCGSDDGCWSDGCACASGEDCASGICGGSTGACNPETTTCTCAAPSCTDALQNGAETDTDCGGSCDPCPEGAGCSVSGDCQSGVCSGGACQAPTCSDSVANGQETGTDCGGPTCGACADGQGCLEDRDCTSGFCNTETQTCAPASCNDDEQNGAETDTDCGGADCPGCPADRGCSVDSDCTSDVCDGNICQAPTCSDGKTNGAETDTDCGGPDCEPCAPEQTCAQASDCTSQVCSDGTRPSDTVSCTEGGACCQYPSCADGVPNGQETDVDCGGVCGGCGPGDTCWTNGCTCASGSDCASGICGGSTGACNPETTTCTCAAPSCTDTLQNGAETDTDCGGPDCTGCSANQDCASGSDCASGVCTNGTCQAPVCGDGVTNGSEVCDDGNTSDCSGDCLGDCSGFVSITGCGDGIICGNETCDDQNTVDTDNCRNDCKRPACGDGFASTDASGDYREECDDGNADDTDDCTNACTLADCGDGIAAVNASQPETCDGLDTRGVSCGDFGFSGGTLACNQTCDDYLVSGCTGGCGNERIEGSEACDGQSLGGTTCAALGFSDGALACSSTCTYDTTGCTGGCGNGAVESGLGEVCDGPNLDGESCATQGFAGGTLSCSSNCESFDTTECTEGCGNGRVEASLGEVCDGANLNGENCESQGFSGGNLGCASTCNTFDTSGCWQCGNGEAEGDELCDSGDKNDYTCELLGFTGGTLGACNGTCDGFDTSGCYTCGDGQVDSTAGEVCDSNNLAGATCQTEGFDGGTLACAGDCGGYDTSDCWRCTDASCPDTSTCNDDGACTCGLYETLCDTTNDGTADTCVSLKTNPNHCGACGNACAANEVCSAGQCVADSRGCQYPLTACNGECVDTSVNNTHCDRCNKSCDTAAGETCLDGRCETSSSAVFADFTGSTWEQNNCVGGGAPISLGTGDALDCTGDLAAVSFRWGMCSCTDVEHNQDMWVDGFDSTEGPYSPTCADGTTPCTTNEDCGSNGPCLDSGAGGLGTNGLYTNNQSSYVSGTVWYSEPVDDPNFGTLLAGQQLHAGHNLPSGTIQVGQDAYVAGDVGGSGSVGGDYYGSHGATLASSFNVAGSLMCGPPPAAAMDADGQSPLSCSPPEALSIMPPCDCSQDTLVDVVGIVDSHACTGGGGATGCAGDNNNNEDIGLDPNLLSSPGDKTRLDLPCGHYYLTEIVNNKAVNIVVHGRTAIYVDGNVDVGRQVNFTLTENAELDMFIKGGLDAGSTVNLGSPNFPARTRVYMAGGQDDGTYGLPSGGSGISPDPSNAHRAISMNNDLTVAANLYAPWGYHENSQQTDMYGSLFVGGYDISQQTKIHFDTAVVNAGETCPDPCGNAQIDADLGEVCDGEQVGATTCQMLGFAGGTLKCNDTCDAFDTSLCFFCGDGTVNGAEQCEPGVTPYDETCADFGFDGGTLSCTDTCGYDTSGCYACGDGQVEGNEVCDGSNLDGETCASLGFDGGTLACDGACGSFDTSGCYRCGNGSVETTGGEVCDPGDTTDGEPPEALNGQTCSSLGFDAGTLRCKADCSFDTSGCIVCGDFVAEGSETCDGTDLRGETCVSQGYDGGTLGCTDACTLDASACYACGDGAINGPEECEPGDLGGETCGSLGFAPESGPLACHADCTYDTTACEPVSVCGDGVLEGAEECEAGELGGGTCSELGYDGGTLACDASTCTYDTSGCTACGNGTVEVGEQCDGSELAVDYDACADFGYDQGSVRCLSDCTVDTSGCSTCGNDTVEADELCDGSDLGGESCASRGYDGGTLRCNGACDGYDESGCYVCGDGVVNGNEACDATAFTESTDQCTDFGFDGPNDGSGVSCKADCTVDTSQCYGCGDGTVNGSEACDGSDLSGETCKSQGFDGGTLACYPNTDANACTFDTSGCTTCGDDTAEGSEACDGADLRGNACADLDGYEAGTLSCTATCTYDTSKCTFCGDGALNGTEECEGSEFGGVTCQELGYGGGQLSCTSSCTIDTSGCSSDCTDGSCPTCGNGVIDAGEECDNEALNGATCSSLGFADGNLGCTSSCTYDTSGCTACTSCRDCNNQACIDGQCTSCRSDGDCCAPLICRADGTCGLPSN